MQINLFPHLSDALSMQRYAAGLTHGLKNHASVRVFGKERSQGYYEKYVRYFIEAREATADPCVILSERFSFLLHALKKSPQKLIICHDLITMANPGVSWLTKKRYGFSLGMMAHADHVVCISNSTRNQLLDFAGDKLRQKVSVIYNGLEPFWLEPGNVPATVSKHGRYFLVVGSDAWYKNFEAVCEACLRMPEGVNVIKAGRFSERSRQLIRSKGLQKRCVELPDVNDKQLKQLYANAIALLQPSWMEGFGWPPAEAMAVGCPVIVSNRGSLPEVCGDAALYIDPSDPSQLGDAMLMLLNQPTTRDEMISKGKLQARKFDWDETAAKFVSLLRGKTSV